MHVLPVIEFFLSLVKCFLYFFKFFFFFKFIIAKFPSFFCNFVI